MNKFVCDICGQDTMINPPTAPCFDEEGNRLTEVIKTMDYNTGEVVETKVPKVKDLGVRTHIIRLSAGQQSIQKDFCPRCLEAVMPEVKALWDKLESIRSK